VNALKFERTDGVSLSGTNPDGVSLSSGVFYGYGGNSSPPYDKQWKATFSPPVAGKSLKLTFRQTNGSLYTYQFVAPNANISANRIPLFGAITSPGSTTTAPPSTTITNPPSST